MNFLAHIYLSFGDPDLTIGNFIGDHIRAKGYLDYAEGIQKGVLLHRAIDTYTDTHPIARSSSKRLHKRHSHYSRVIVDIYYDHFLARNWSRYHDTDLEAFTLDFYRLCRENFEGLPKGVQRFLPYMISSNWLLSYASLDGIAQVLQGMDRRAGDRSRMDEAISDLQWHYEEFESEFHEFFVELVTFSKHKIQQL